MDRVAKKLRKTGADLNVYGPNELTPLRKRLGGKELAEIWTRPFLMFFREPIVAFLSLLSGFSDAVSTSYFLDYHDDADCANFRSLYVS